MARIIPATLQIYDRLQKFLIQEYFFLVPRVRYCQMSLWRDVASRLRASRWVRCSAFGLLLVLPLGGFAPAQAAAEPVAGPPTLPAPARALRRELDRAEAQLRERILPLAPGPGIEILRDPQRVVLRVPARLLFDAESTIPREDAAARPLLMAVRQLLRGRTRLVGRIEVYTDGIGAVDANLHLSQQRADALMAWFTEEGVPGARLQAVGRGASEPLAGDDAPEGRMRNRRVELIFEHQPAG